MTSPGREVPDKAKVASSVQQYQDANKETLAGLSNGDLLSVLQMFGNNLFHGLLGGFTNVGNAIFSGIQGIVTAITGVVNGGLNTLQTYFEQLLRAGQGLPLLGPIASGLLDFFFHQAAVANTASTAASAASSAQVDATAAIAEATQANNTVMALINGGTRTIYTSNFTYTKPANLVKLGVILFGGGGAGANQSGGNTVGGALGGVGGGYVYYEFPASAVPASVAGTIAAGRNGGSNNRANTQSTFGALATSPAANTGGVADARGFVNVQPSAPGDGGNAAIYGGNANAWYAGSPGGDSQLATGGAGGSSSGAAGKNGENAPTTGQTLAGGGAGGGGAHFANFNTQGPAPGGAGGFPGGPGGGGGYVGGVGQGGPGAPALIALIEFMS